MFVPTLRTLVRRLSRPAPRRPRRPGARPRLEGLEARWLPSTLTGLNNADSGPGSLRAALAAAHSGDTIVFDDSLRGQTITLTSGALVVDKSLDIEGPAAADLTVSGNDARRVFDISGSGVAVTLAGLTIAHGQAPAPMPGSPAPGGGVYDPGAAPPPSHRHLAN